MRTNEPDVIRLLDEARRGNASALGELLELYRQYLTLLTRARIGRNVQAKIGTSDVVQETLFQAQQAFAQFRGASERELIAWLRRILARQIVNRVYRQFSQPRRAIDREEQLIDELDTSSAAMMGLAARQSSPSESAARREQEVLLANALESLPEDYRTVIMLRHVEGLVFAEVAQRMDRSLASVEKLWMRALNQLRKTLGDSP